MNILFKEFKYTCDGDKWGNCMKWAFSLCDYLTEKSQCPEYWNFKQSPLGADIESFEYQQIEALMENGDISINDLLYFSSILYRYHNILIAQGKDY